MNAFQNPLFATMMARKNALRHRPQFHYWQGASGTWYIHSVYEISDWPLFNEQNYVFASKWGDGRVQAVYIGQTGSGYERARNHEKLWPALLLGATQVHVHLLAESQHARLKIETDLRHGHPTPLNRQGLGITPMRQRAE